VDLSTVLPSSSIEDSKMPIVSAPTVAFDELPVSV